MFLGVLSYTSDQENTGVVVSLRYGWLHIATQPFALERLISDE